MSWAQYDKGQEVIIRALGGWIRGQVSETYDSSVSVTYGRGSKFLTTRIYDLRNIKPWQTKQDDQSTSNDQLSFE